MNDLLSGARWKIERANHHIQDIERRVAEFAASHAHKLTTEFDPATGLNKIRFESGERLNEIVNLALGDAVHNLRASLDYVWGKAVTTLDPSADITQLHFPAGRDSKNSCKGVLDDGEKEHAKAISTPVGQKLRDLILEVLKPYGTRDNPFCMLNELDNIDKHRLLLTLFVYGGLHAQDVRLGTNRLRNLTIVTNRPVAPLIASPHEIEGEMKPAVQVFITEATLTKHEDLRPTLKNLLKVVSEAVDAIENCLLTHGNTP